MWRKKLIMISDSTLHAFSILLQQMGRSLGAAYLMKNFDFGPSWDTVPDKQSPPILGP